MSSIICVQGAADGSPYVRQVAAQVVPKVIGLSRTLLGSMLDGVLLRLMGDVEVGGRPDTRERKREIKLTIL